MLNIPNPPAIGQNVKKQRTELKMSMDKLAKKSGVSKAMLSQIESDKVNPTIATMWKIAHALEVDFNLLLKGHGQKIRKFQVNRHEDITTLDANEDGVLINVLSPISMAEDLELYTLKFAPNSILNSSPHCPGTEEFLTVLSGEVKVTVEQQSTTLREGDLINYESDAPHSIENLLDSEAQIYLVVRFAK